MSWRHLVECQGCGHQHDGTYSRDFCSHSCYLAWRARRSNGFGVKGSGRYVGLIVAVITLMAVVGCAAKKPPVLCLPSQPAPAYTGLQCFPVDVQSGQVMCVKQIQFGGGQ